MAIAVSDVIIGIQQHFSGISDAVALQCINNAQVDMLTNVRLDADDTEDFNLVAETQEYALDDRIVKIWDAEYWTSSDAKVHLKQINMDWLDNNRQYWRSATSGAPTYIYDNGPNVGLFTKPNLTTTSGYPFVRLYVSRMTDDLDASDSLPTPVLTKMAWVYNSCLQFAIMQHQEQIVVYEAFAAREFEKLKAYSRSRMARDRPSVRRKSGRVRFI